MEDIVERLRYGANCPVSGDGDEDKIAAANEIESLRVARDELAAQLAATQQELAEVARERMAHLFPRGSMPAYNMFEEAASHRAKKGGK